MSEALLEMIGISKSFAGVEVLHEVNLRLEKEVLGLVGKNGAGKSTLMKILFGVEKADKGQVAILGKDYNPARLDAQRSKNIAMIFQELSLIPTLSVAENIFLSAMPKTGIGLIDRKACKEKAARTLEALHVQIDPSAEVQSLSVAEKQSVEIAKAVVEQRKILIMDEPSAALSADQVESLFRLIRDLKAQGIAIIYISHNLRELFQVCDRIAILKDGRNVLTSLISDTSMEAVIEGITGSKSRKESEQATETVPNPQKARSGLSEPLLSLEAISIQGKLRDISFSVNPGEIVGIAGLTGSGRSELLEAVYGSGHFGSGIVRIRNRRLRGSSPHLSIARGLILIPDDRQTKGLVLEHSVRTNMTLPILDKIKRFLFINTKRERQQTESLARHLNIVAASVEQKVNRLSGGNQQKVVLSKAISAESQILLLDDPTVGIDVESKREILSMIRALVSKGKAAAVLVCSELEWLAEACDRVLILQGGSIVRELDKSRGDDISESRLLSLV